MSVSEEERFTYDDIVGHAQEHFEEDFRFLPDPETITIEDEDEVVNDLAMNRAMTDPNTVISGRLHLGVQGDTGIYMYGVSPWSGGVCAVHVMLGEKDMFEKTGCRSDIQWSLPFRYIYAYGNERITKKRREAAEALGFYYFCADKAYLGGSFVYHGDFYSHFQLACECIRKGYVDALYQEQPESVQGSCIVKLRISQAAWRTLEPKYYAASTVQTDANPVDVERDDTPPEVREDIVTAEVQPTSPGRWAEAASKRVKRSHIAMDSPMRLDDDAEEILQNFRNHTSAMQNKVTMLEQRLQAANDSIAQKDTRFNEESEKASHLREQLEETLRIERHMSQTARDSLMEANVQLEAENEMLNRKIGEDMAMKEFVRSERETHKMEKQDWAKEKEKMEKKIKYLEFHNEALTKEMQEFFDKCV